MAGRGIRRAPDGPDVDVRDSSGERAGANVLERAAASHEIRETLPRRESRGGPVEILVRGTLTAHPASHAREDAMRIEPVERREPCATRLAEFEHHDAAPWPEHAGHLAEP